MVKSKNELIERGGGINKRVMLRIKKNIMKDSPLLDYIYNKTPHFNQMMRNLHDVFYDIFFMISNIILNI